MKEYCLYAYPFLAGLFPILFLYTRNIVEVSFSKFLKCSIIYTGIFLMTLVIVTLLVTNHYKASFDTFITIIFLYNAGKILRKFYNGNIIKTCSKIFVLGIFIGLYFINNTKIFYITAKIMIPLLLIIDLLFVIKIISFFCKKTSTKNQVKNGNIEQKTTNNKDLPDIYFLMPDGYANQNILKEKFNYDNTDFIEFLKTKGFDVNENAQSNYTFTEVSMGTTINLDYFDNLFVTDKQASYQDNMDNFLKLYSDNKLFNILKSYGYNIIHLINQTEQAWGFVNTKGVFEIQPKDLNEFEKVLIKNTFLGIIFLGSLEKENQAGMLNYFRELENISQYENSSPSFVYAHIFCPHPPYLFDKDGKFPSKELDWNNLDDNNKLYLDQLTYLNKRLKTIIENILNNNRTREKVIIIQSDHGCCMHLETVNKYMDKNIWDQRRFVLRAIKSSKKLDFDFDTNINLFRAIFNTYLGMDFQKLHEITFYSDNSELTNKIFEFEDGNKKFSGDV